MAGRWPSLVGTATEPGGHQVRNGNRNQHIRVWLAAPAKESQYFSRAGQAAGPKTKGGAGAWRGGEGEAAAESSMELRLMQARPAVAKSSSGAGLCGQLCRALGHVLSLGRVRGHPWVALACARWRWSPVAAPRHGSRAARAAGLPHPSHGCLPLAGRAADLLRWVLT